VGKHSLIIDAVLLVGRPARRDIGWQRHRTALLNRLVKNRAVKREGERHLAALPLVFHRRIKLAEEADFALAAEPHHVARLKPPARPHERAPARPIDPSMQRRFDPGLFTTADPPPHEARRDHAGIVDHDRIARLQQLRQVAHGAVFGYTTRAYDQEPRRIPR
jgi:hypothetical protein